MGWAWRNWGRKGGGKALRKRNVDIKQDRRSGVSVEYVANLQGCHRTKRKKRETDD